MAEIHYRYYIGQGSEAQALIDKVRAENKAEYNHAEALAHEYGAQTVICRGEEVYGLFYLKKTAEPWLRYEQSFEDGYIYVPDKRTKQGKEFARRLDVFRRRTCSARILKELHMVSAVLGMKNGQGILATSVAGFNSDTGVIVLKVPYSEGNEHKLPAPPSWLRPCKKSELLAAQRL